MRSRPFQGLEPEVQEDLREEDQEVVEPSQTENQKRYNFPKGIIFLAIDPFFFIPSQFRCLHNVHANIKLD